MSLVLLEGNSSFETIIAVLNQAAPFITALMLAVTLWGLPWTVRKLKSEVSELRAGIDAHGQTLVRTAEEAESKTESRLRELQLRLDAHALEVARIAKDAGNGTEELIRDLDHQWRAALKKSNPVCVNVESARSIIKIGLTRNLHEMLSEYESSVLPQLAAATNGEVDRTAIERLVRRRFSDVVMLTRLFFRDFEVSSHNIAEAFDRFAPENRGKTDGGKIEGYDGVVKQVIDVTVDKGLSDRQKSLRVRHVLEEANLQSEARVLDWIGCSRENCGKKLRR